MYDFESLALTHSASCFLNALLREFDGFTIEKNTVLIPLENDKTILIPLKFNSVLGRHQYTDQFYLAHGEITQEISFIAMVEILSKMLVLRYSDSEEKAQIFIARVENSLHNITLSLQSRYQDIEKLYSRPANFQEAEQGLMVGHNFHPYPKMREGFDDSDFKIYSPEMAGHFPLTWFYVNPQILHNQGAHQYPKKEWLFDLYLSDFVKAPEIPTGYLPFPVHTWQKQHLLKNQAVKEYLAQGLILEGPKSENPWYPTSSLRSVYGAHSNYMLKFSLTLRLTNSVRHLTDVEVVRGLQVYDVFATAKGQEFVQEFPNFKVIFEPAFVALKNAEGQLISESIVVARENPFKQGAGENIVLSTLAQDNPLGGPSLIQKHVRAFSAETGLSLKEAGAVWFKKYLDIAVRPLIVAQAKYGILLGAHQQNLILGLENHLPVRGYFRDCQGTGYSQRGYDLYHKDVALMVKENGNILDDKGNILFGYYLIVNSTFNVISVMAEVNGVNEQDLLAVLTDFVKDLAAKKYPDQSFFVYLLQNENIYQKGNFNCSLQNLNENTTANPLAIYNLIKNPLFQKEGLV